jgi:hypothetical protein
MLDSCHGIQRVVLNSYTRMNVKIDNNWEEAETRCVLCGTGGARQLMNGEDLEREDVSHDHGSTTNSEDSGLLVNMG